MEFARILIVKAKTAATKAVENQSTNEWTCKTFDAIPLLFEAASESEPASIKFDEIEDQTIKVVNDTISDINVDDVFRVGQNIQGRWILLEQKPQNAGRIRFITTGKMTNRLVQVLVTEVVGNAINPNDGQLFKRNDYAFIADRNNIYPEVERDATGWAFWQAPFFGLPGRWEIEKCTMPVREVIGITEECTCVNAGSYRYRLRVGNAVSGHPYTDIPPEWQKIGGVWYMFAENPMNLRTIPNTEVVAVRISNQISSEPKNWSVPRGGSATSSSWQITNVRKPLAKWVKVRKDGDADSGSDSGWEIINFYDGVDPREGCSTPVVCGLDCDCLEDGDEGFAFFNANNCSYVVVSTQSALYGEFKDTDVLIDAKIVDDNLEFDKVTTKLPCKEDAEPDKIPLTDCDDEGSA